MRQYLAPRYVARPSSDRFAGRFGGERLPEMRRLVVRQPITDAGVGADLLFVDLNYASDCGASCYSTSGSLLRLVGLESRKRFLLSTNARHQKDTEVAKERVRKALQIFEKTRDVRGVVHLGKLAEHAREFGDAETLYGKALETAKANGNDEQEAYSYRYLGNLAGQQRDYETSKMWYEKALTVYEKGGDMANAAKCCLSLGNLCLSKVVGMQRAFVSAKKWFRKALETDDTATWRNWLILHARLWRYRFLSVIGR